MEISLLTYGDSIMWGQGLDPATKFSTLAFKRLATYVAAQGISVESYANAHSGATIWPVGDSDSKGFTWGEVPVSWPSIVAQVDAAAHSMPGGLNGQPCIVLLDGGINDVSLNNIFTIDPTIWDKPAWIAKITTNAVGPRMQDLLTHVFTQFPQAYVIVTGYYQIVSAYSERNAAAAALGPFLSGLFPEAPIMVSQLLPALPAQCAAFAQAAQASLTDAIGSFNATLGQQRVFFAQPTFGPHNALAAEVPYLWMGSDDPLAAARRRWMSQQPPFTAPLYTPVASLGHPNVMGARVYAGAVNRQLARFIRQLAPLSPTQFGPNEDWTGGAFYGSRGTYFADVDGDGRADAIAVNDDGVYVRLSNGSGFVGPAVNWTGGAYYGSRGIFFADVTGDGSADAIVVNDDGVYVRPSTGFGFGPARRWTDIPFYGSRGTFFADVNGDGMADAIAVNDDGIYVRLSDGYSFVGPARKWTDGAFYDLTRRGMHFADVTGDGRADAIVVNDDGVYVRPSTGSGFAPAQNWTGGAFYGSRGTYFADVDGNGRADAIAVNDTGVTVRRSNGSRFQPNEDWSHGAYYGSMGNSVYFADVTGDGCQDALVINSDRVTVRRVR